MLSLCCWKFFIKIVKMKVKTSKLTLLSSLYSLLFMFYLVFADDENCCSFPTDDCSDVFHGTGISLECQQSLEIPNQDGECLPVPTEHQANSGGQVELVDVEIMYQVRCPSQPESDCKLSSGRNYIGLNITFNITAGSVEGIQFNLQTVEGEVKPIVGTLKKSCHNLNFSGVLTADMANDRLFSYTKYVGLHPGSLYSLTARSFSNSYASQHYVSIPDCRKMKDWEDKQKCENSSECEKFGKWSEDFFCNIPSPASFAPEMWVYENLSVTATIWNEDPPFSSYVLILHDTYLDWQRKELHIESGQTTLHHQFSVNVPAGSYVVQMYGQPDRICKADQHWGSNLCPSANSRVTISEDVNHCKNPQFCSHLEYSDCVVDKEVATCKCSDGFVLNKTNGHCEDIDECETIFNRCDVNGHCVNTLGNYTCKCSKGFRFSREKFTCEDVDECKTTFNMCGVHGFCNNTEGSAHCICEKGYESNTDKLICEEQKSMWMIFSVSISIALAGATIISFIVFVMKRCYFHCKRVKPLDQDIRTVTSDSDLVHYTPRSLILEPPSQLRGPLESIEGGSDEPLMDNFLRCM